MEKGWVLAYTFTVEYVSELAKQMLRDNNISAVIINKKDSAYRTFGELELYVHFSNIIKAKKLLEEFEKAS